MNVLTLWLAVDASTADNGCLRVIRGTHKTPLAALREDKRTLNVLGSETHSDAEVEARGWGKDIVDLELAPGDLSVHDPAIVHGSKANTSASRRAGLTLRYISPSTECLDPEQPLLMMRGEPVPGINTYRSWPKYRPDRDLPFKGAEGWNERRRAVAADEAYFARTDYDAMDREIAVGLEVLISKLGGRKAVGSG
jgi:hypothetical protein